MMRATMLRILTAVQPDRATPEQRSRLRAWTWLVAGVLLGQVVWMLLLRGPRILDHDVVLIMGQLILGMGLVGIGGLISTTPHDALRIDARTSRRIIIGGAILLQLLAVLLLWPALSEELPRYRIDGLTWLSGQSPYATPPAMVNDNKYLDDVDGLVRAPRQRSIYPPVAQTVFIAARGIEMGMDSADVRHPVKRWRDALPQLDLPQRGLVMRLFAAAAAIGCVVVLLKILDGRGATPWLAVLLAWNPLLLIEAGGMGHVDIIGVLLLLVMFRMLQNARPALATLALCLACGIKPTAVLLAPLLIRQIWLMRDWKSAQRSIGVVAATLVLVYLPIWSVQSGLWGWIEAMKGFAQVERGNSLAIGLFGEHAMTRMFPPLIAIALLLWLLRRKINMEDAAYWLLLATLLASPVALPRMVLWPLCLVPLVRHSVGWAALAWSATAAFAYASWHQPGLAVPGRILAAEYLPVALAMAIQIRESFAWKPAPVPVDAAASA